MTVCPREKLGALCAIKGGGTPSRTIEEYYKGPIPWATVKDFISTKILDTQEHITEEAIKNSASNLITEGAILVVTRMGLGKVAIAGVDLAINQDVKALSVIDDRIDTEYLFWFLLSKASYFESVGTGATVKGIKLDILTNLDVPIPPIPEQKRIVEILKRAEGIIRLRREQLAKTRALIPALFIDMFGDPATNPKGWEEVTLGDVFKLKSGSFLPKKNMADNGQFPVYGGNGISGHHDEYLFEEKTIVIGRVGEYCGAIHYATQKSWITDNALYVAERFKEFNDLFMVEILRALRLNKYASRAGQPLVSGGRIYPVKGFLPPLELQNGFADKLVDLHELLKQAETALGKQEALFQSLLHHAFAGEL